MIVQGTVQDTLYVLWKNRSPGTLVGVSAIRVSLAKAERGRCDEGKDPRHSSDGSESPCG